MVLEERNSTSVEVCCLSRLLPCSYPKKAMATWSSSSSTVQALSPAASPFPTARHAWFEETFSLNASSGNTDTQLSSRPSSMTLPFNFTPSSMSIGVSVLILLFPVFYSEDL